MRNHLRRSRIAHFKAPFLVSIAGAAVAAACGGRTPTDMPDGLDDSQLTSDGAGGAGASAGTGGAPAASTYGNAGAGGSNPPGLWTYGPAVYTPCEEIPVAGSDCDPRVAQACGFPGCEGPTSNHVQCLNGQWLIEYSSGPACNPPAVVPVCPERIILGEPCTYEGQECVEDSCEGVSERALTVCTADRGWKRVTRDCPAPVAVDAGAAAAADAEP